MESKALIVDWRKAKGGEGGCGHRAAEEQGKSALDS